MPHPNHPLISFQAPTIAFHNHESPCFVESFQLFFHLLLYLLISIYAQRSFGLTSNPYTSFPSSDVLNYLNLCKPRPPSNLDLVIIFQWTKCILLCEFVWPQRKFIHNWWIVLCKWPPKTTKYASNTLGWFEAPNVPKWFDVQRQRIRCQQINSIDHTLKSWNTNSPMNYGDS